MPAERAGYTVTMFLIDISPSMGTVRTVQLPSGPHGETQSTEMTHLQWALQFVKLKIQEMVYNGRKTDQCGVIVFGSEGTENIINEKNGGYEHVSEYIPIAHHSAATLAKLDKLQPSGVVGDPIDALIVGIETQENYLAVKKTWTRKIILVTDGENPIEIEDWEAIVEKMNDKNTYLTVVGVDFDDEDFPYIEPNKTEIKRINEEFYAKLVAQCKNGILGTYAHALQAVTRPDITMIRSALLGTILRLGDVDVRSDEAFEICVKTSKCTALQRPKGWKKFAIRDVRDPTEQYMSVDGDDDEAKVTFAELRMRTEYYVDRTEPGNTGMDCDEDGNISEDRETKNKEEHLEKVEKDDLVRGFKYGTTYAPCPDGQFPKLRTRKGIDICGFFPEKNYRREWAMGEVQYIWAEPTDPRQQIALSSIVQAMYEKGVCAIARWVLRDGVDPKMGVLHPSVYEKVDCLMWVQMPFADDVRQYTFASLDNLLSKKGEVITEHPYIPTLLQQEAMDHLVDAMDLMDAGEKDEEGERQPWFDPLQSYNPVLHRVKHALFHSAVVSDVTTNPLPPPHPELVKFFNPSKRVVKRSRDALEECKNVFHIKKVPKRIAQTRKGGHEHAQGDNDILLLDNKVGMPANQSQLQIKQTREYSERAQDKEKIPVSKASDTEDEDEMLLDRNKPSTSLAGETRNAPLPTPARSASPQVDLGRAPGRIIGTTFPLKDFLENIARGDMVSKAVEDLAAVITEVVLRPFTKRRTEELVQCMESLRDTCLQEDEIEVWNTFLEELKVKSLSKPGNPEFWASVQGVGSSLGLIGEAEAKKYGGTSRITDKRAQEVRNE